MAYRYGDRKQRTLFPQSIDEYIPQDAPVRAYDAIIDSLDFAEIGIVLDPNKVGCPQYDPKVMLKLLVYGYSYGFRSSRKLERETHYNLSFIWLTSGLKPDHKTIADFRRNNKSALKKVLRQCAGICIKLDLIEGNTLFVDGSSLRANASIKNTWDKKRCERHLKKIDKRIEQILLDCEAIDIHEEGQSSLVKINQEVGNQERLKARVKEILKELETKAVKSINTTDPECARTGSHAGYNMQMVVDNKHGLIVSSDVVNEANDLHQFDNQITEANKVAEHKCQNACADSGYFNVDHLEKIDQQKIKVIVPSQRQASGKPPGFFDKQNFRYDRIKDCYICPAGQALRYRRTNIHKKRKEYMADTGLCKRCGNFGICTNSRTGRKVTRLLKEDLRERLESQYQQPSNQQIYKLRKQKVEPPFGHIKWNLKAGSLLLKGIEGAKAEASLLASCFNIVRMISIIGVQGLLVKLAG